MTTAVEDLGHLAKCLTISIPAEAIQAQVGKRLAELSKTAKMKGFRPGKVPMNVVEMQFGESVKQEEINRLIDQYYDEALKQNNIDPIDRPEVELTQVPKNNEALEVKIIVEVSPDIQFDQLNQINLERPVVAISDSDIDETLVKFQEMSAGFEVVARESAKGDQIVVDFKGELDDGPLQHGEAENFSVVIGSQRMIPGFEEGLIGLKAGDETVLSLAFPAEYHAKEVAGKPVRFQIKVKQVMAKQLPELSDEFAKRFGVPEGLAVLRERVKENLVKQADLMIKNQMKAQLVEKLQNHFQIELPERALKNEIHFLQHQDCNHDHEHDHAHEHHHAANEIDQKELEQKAKRQLLLRLVFAAFIKKFEVTVESKEIQQLIQERAYDFEDPNQVQKLLNKKNELLEKFQNMALENKIFDTLFKHITLNDKTYQYQELQNLNQEV